jgi:2-phosphosulfolactate phosphatase
MNIKIHQGNDHLFEPSDINVVIDVIRAFTVAHYALLNGAKEILLVGTLEEAFQLKKRHPDFLLAGEVAGLPIEGFDLDNSPARIANQDLTGKTLVQKTTNGVKATLHALNAEHVFVTGFSNARTTARHIANLCKQANRDNCINIIASHPSSDDDLACAEYMQQIIQGAIHSDSDDIVARIKGSIVASKFFDETKSEFNFMDILYCSRELDSPFVMKVNRSNPIPTIERIHAW